jgi:hypothetical protein
MQCKEYLHETARDWILEEEDEGIIPMEGELADCWSAPRRPKKDMLGRLSGDFSKHKLEKIVGGKGQKAERRI